MAYDQNFKEVIKFHYYLFSIFLENLNLQNAMEAILVNC